jgi:2-iminobutanoate/2-iminopropanoate deaminase
MPLKQIKTNLAPPALGAYSQAVQTNQLLFISGQLPIDPSTGLLVASNIVEQTRRVLDNVAAILDASHLSFKHVVRCEVFLHDMDDFAAFNEEYKRYFLQPVPPARQTIQAMRLPMDALIEISCIAILDA